MKKVLLAATLMVGSMSAMAADTGVYGGFNLALANLSSNANAGVTQSTGVGAGGHIGYNFNKMFAAEASFNQLAGWKASVVDVSSGIFSVSGLGFYPIEKGMDVYGKLGFSNVNVNFSCNGGVCPGANKSQTALNFGGGVEFGHGEARSFRLSYDHYDLGAFPGIPMTANVFSVGANFQF